MVTLYIVASASATLGFILGAIMSRSKDYDDQARVAEQICRNTVRIINSTTETITN